MSQTKQHKKINKLQLKAELCLDRDAAKEIILKANKVQNKFRQLP
jgi:hypothetical protein|tara:strand:+ start:21 stop:155 length:135 start_codon:yes stop_codon:yes gene_type:complete